ncbi:hypothetical protein FB567DRAFT_552061 [Paraphoma chrysanthemicola]|uniref:Ankyrin n=1 Tax=Paraphoma chrysanthemicola TaxID=798071 RepID=A0A8K0QZ64_9PLEO|nr:hypothetical protein FB567DRAFT_552061 [Paraphoma chrysanthemicola]
MKRGLRLRLVSKAFDSTVTQVLYASKLLDDAFKDDHKLKGVSGPLMESYLTHRIMSEPRSGNSLLNSLRDIATEIHAEQASEDATAESLEACIQRMCKLILIGGYGSLRHYNRIFETKTAISEEEHEDHRLAAALGFNSLSVVKRCVAKDPSVLSRHPWDAGSSVMGFYTSLAAKYADTEILAFLLPQSELLDRFRSNLFVSAAYAGRLDIVQFVHDFVAGQPNPWEFGQDSSRRGDEHRALFDAWHTTSLPVMEYIEELRARYPVWAGDREMAKNDMLARSAGTGKLDAVAYLLKQGADAKGERAIFEPYITNAPVVKACANGTNMAIIELLLQHGADAEAAVTAAANFGRKEVLQHLLGLGLSPTNTLSKLRFGPFMDIVQVLLEAGVDPNEASGANSLLAKAIQLEHTALFKLLIAHGADVHAPGTAEECVRQANKDGLDSMLQLLQEHGVDITAAGNSHQSTT